MKLGMWILVMVGMGGTPLAHAGSTFSSGETPQVSAHLDFQITIQPSLKEAWMPTTPHGREGFILAPCKA